MGQAARGFLELVLESARRLELRRQRIVQALGGRGDRSAADEPDRGEAAPLDQSSSFMRGYLPPGGLESVGPPPALPGRLSKAGGRPAAAPAERAGDPLHRPTFSRSHVALEAGTVPTTPPSLSGYGEPLTGRGRPSPARRREAGLELRPPLLSRSTSPDTRASEPAEPALLRLLAAHMERTARREALMGEAVLGPRTGLTSPIQHTLYGAGTGGEGAKAAVGLGGAAGRPAVPFSPSAGAGQAAAASLSAGAGQAAHASLKEMTLPGSGSIWKPSWLLPSPSLAGRGQTGAVPGAARPAGFYERPPGTLPTAVSQVPGAQQLREQLARILREDGLRHGIELKEG